jgi:hypothetical protein
MPTASDIAIKINGVDITNKVIYSSARFESQLGAIPGTAEITVKDEDQTFDATTGDELTLDIDGVRLWGGRVLIVARIFALPVVDTSTPGNVLARQFRLSAIDYNILFDKRIIHNPADHLHHFPFFALDQTMGALIRDELTALYLDLDDDGLDTTTFVDNGFAPRFDANGNPDPDGTKSGSWPQQGSYWRKAMEDFAQFGFIYYIDGSKNLHFHEVEDSVAPWGFSDVPNKLPLPNAGATYGMREYEDVEDGSAMANDAFVWGGSEWAGTGGTVFARKQNSASITAHQRWQYPEVRFGELRTQGEVTARANVIVSGNTTGAVGGDTSRGLAVDQKQVRVAWFGHDVPLLSGVKAHLLPSDVVTFSMYVMTEDGINPLVIVLPLRTFKITFPTLPPDGTPAEPTTYVRFDGFFGVQLSDPWWMWKLLRDLKPTVRQPPVIATADGSSTTAIYGAVGSFEPSPATNGSTTVFSIPFAYIAETTQVYQGPPGELRLLTPGSNYTESDPENGEITITSAPPGTDDLWVICRIAGGYA